MRAELKSLHSPDIDLDTFRPDDPSKFGFLLQAMIGPEGEDGAESFDIQVCTPQWLLDRHSQGECPNVIFGAQMMVVFSYDLSQVLGALKHYCQKCVGKDWQTLASKLSRLGAWEFEDYH